LGSLGGSGLGICLFADLAAPVAALDEAMGIVAVGGAEDIGADGVETASALFVHLAVAVVVEAVAEFGQRLWRIAPCHGFSHLLASLESGACAVLVDPGARSLGTGRNGLGTAQARGVAIAGVSVVVVPKSVGTVCRGVGLQPAHRCARISHTLIVGKAVGLFHARPASPSGAHLDAGVAAAVVLSTFLSDAVCHARNLARAVVALHL